MFLIFHNKGIINGIDDIIKENLTPVFAVILSLIILRERFSWLFWVGGACILGGIIITNRFAGAKGKSDSVTE